jgi:hypothetical protein
MLHDSNVTVKSNETRGKQVTSSRSATDDVVMHQSVPSSVTFSSVADVAEFLLNSKKSRTKNKSPVDPEVIENPLDEIFAANRSDAWLTSTRSALRVNKAKAAGLDPDMNTNRAGLDIEEKILRLLEDTPVEKAMSLNHRRKGTVEKGAMEKFRRSVDMGLLATMNTSRISKLGKLGAEKLGSKEKRAKNGRYGHILPAYYSVALCRDHFVEWGGTRGGKGDVPHE